MGVLSLPTLTVDLVQGSLLRLHLLVVLLPPGPRQAGALLDGHTAPLPLAELEDLAAGLGHHDLGNGTPVGGEALDQHPEQGNLAVDPARQQVLVVLRPQQLLAGRLGQFRLVGTGILEKGYHDQHRAIRACWLTLGEMLRLLGVITDLTEGRWR